MGTRRALCLVVLGCALAPAARAGEPVPASREVYGPSLDEVCARERPPPSPPPAAAAPVCPPPDPLGEREARRAAEGRVLAEVAVGFELGGRRFSYSDALSPNLPTYAVLGAPVLAGEVALYPAAASGVAFLQDLGLRGWVARAVGLDSTTPGGTRLGTEWTRFGGELHARIPLPVGPDRARLGVGVGVDGRWFDLLGDGVAAAQAPGARVVSLRLGLDARVRLGARVALFADGAYLHPLAFEGVYRRFRDPVVAGFDVGGGLGVRLAAGLELRLLARYARAFASFHPQPGDAAVAGGALDEQVHFGLRIAYAH